MHVSTTEHAAADSGPVPRQDEQPQNSFKNRIDAGAGPERLAYRIDDAAVVSGLSRSTLYELIKSGTLRSVKISGRRLITRTALLELLGSGAE